MEVKSVVLCSAATPHPDGTFSLLRGGVDTWGVVSFPAQIQFGLVVILELLSTEVGIPHLLELDVIDADGHRVIPQTKIPFSIPVRTNTTRYKFNLVMGNGVVQVIKIGTYSVQVGVDGRNLSSTEFQIVQAAPPQAG
jgi:hypothetical protein